MFVFSIRYWLFLAFMITFSIIYSVQWRIQDFPEEGRQLPGGRQHTILPNFPKNCMKLKEYGPPGGARPSHPP